MDCGSIDSRVSLAVLWKYILPISRWLLEKFPVPIHCVLSEMGSNVITIT